MISITQDAICIIVFMSPDNSVFGVNNIAAIILAVVGGLHTFKVIHEVPAGGALRPGEMAPPADPSMDFTQPINAGAVQSNSSTWADLRTQAQ